MTETITITPADDLQHIFDTAPENAEIRLAPGEYRQKTVIRTPGLRLTGAGMDKTRLVWDDYALKLDEQGREYNTFRTWTMAVCADRIRMEDLAVINDALHPEIKGQEVALSVLGDDFSMENCLLSSTQDTLFAGPLPPDLIVRYAGFHAPELLRGGHMRQVYDRCRIEGTVDFIFGCADALFDNCEIRSVYDARDIGYAAAPAHPLEQQEGFVFRNCSFPGMRASRTAASISPGPGGTTGWLSLRTAATVLTSPRSVLTNGTTRPGTGQPAFVKCRRSRDG